MIEPVLDDQLQHVLDYVSSVITLDHAPANNSCPIDLG